MKAPRRPYARRMSQSTTATTPMIAKIVMTIPTFPPPLPVFVRCKRIPTDQTYPPSAVLCLALAGSGTSPMPSQSTQWEVACVLAP